MLQVPGHISVQGSDDIATLRAWGAGGRGGYVCGCLLLRGNRWYNRDGVENHNHNDIQLHNCSGVNVGALTKKH